MQQLLLGPMPGSRATVCSLTPRVLDTPHQLHIQLRATRAPAIDMSVCAQMVSWNELMEVCSRSFILPHRFSLHPVVSV